MSCLGWYCGKTGQARWLASKSPKSGLSKASSPLESASVVGDTMTKNVDIDEITPKNYLSSQKTLKDIANTILFYFQTKW